MDVACRDCGVCHGAGEVGASAVTAEVSGVEIGQAEGMGNGDGRVVGVVSETGADVVEEAGDWVGGVVHVGVSEVVADAGDVELEP